MRVICIDLIRAFYKKNIRPEKSKQTEEAKLNLKNYFKQN